MANADHGMKLFGGHGGITLVEDRGLGVEVGGLVRWRFANNGDLVSQGGDVLDANGEPLGGGAALTGWETDADGNFVCTGDGAIKPSDLTKPVTIKSKFQSGGPANSGEGEFFRVISDNYNDDIVPSDYKILDFDEYNYEMGLYGFIFVVHQGSNLTFRSSVAYTEPDYYKASMTGLNVDAGVGRCDFSVYGQNNVRADWIFQSDGAAIFPGLLQLGSTTLLRTSVALTNGAAASIGTLTNAPTAGNPTKWIPLNDNGTTRYIPAW